MLVTVKHLYSVYWPYIIEIMLTQVSAYNVHRNFFFFLLLCPARREGAISIAFVRPSARPSVRRVHNK